MEIRKTTILPTDSKSLARRIFADLVNEQPYVLFVVLGKDKVAETLVQRASRLAGKEEEPRHVVWARRPEQISEEIAALKGDETLKSSLADALAFTLSLSDAIADVIGKNEPEPDLVRIFKAFAKAEAMRNA